MELTSKDFDSFLKKNKTCVVDFWAPWCGPCRMLAPNLEEVCGEKKVPLGKVNIDADPDLAMKYGVMSIPCVIKFKDCQDVDRFIGTVPRERITKFIS